MNLSSETFELAKILSLCTNAKLRSEVLSKSTNVTGSAKYFIKQSVTNRLTGIENDIKGIFDNSPEDLEILMADLMNYDSALQLENIENLFLEMPKEIRDDIEMYIENKHALYCQERGKK